MEQELKNKAAKILEPYEERIIELMGEDFIHHSEYPGLVKAVVERATHPRIALDSLEYLRQYPPQT